jgi:hypothetical protein
MDSVYSQKNICVYFMGKVINPVCPLCKEKVALRQRILADFIIGGFALANSEGILTLDFQYYKNYFPRLKILA